MNARQILKYAKENGFNEVMVSVKNNEGRQICVAKFLDAYYEFLQIPIVGDGFVTMDTLEELFGYDLLFEPIDKKTFISGAFLDFALRGKQVPKNIREEFNSFVRE